ncbi:MAG: serine hydrolase domain-containing protein [Phycisphaerae bacterium]
MKQNIPGSPLVRLAILALALPLVTVLGQACTSGRNLPPAEADAEVVRFLSNYMPELAKRHDFNGVVLFARDEKVLFHQAYGLANRSDSVRNETSTRFNMASASKMFTAVAVAKLAEEGWLSFDDMIGKYLGSDWVSPEVGRKVLIRHLLAHTSGLGMYWDEWDQYADQIRTIEDYRLVVSDDLAFEPGTRSEYSNTGYILLGAIIEKVSGETYYDFVRRTIFEPCGMTSTGFYINNEVQEGLAVGYFKDKDDRGKLKDNLSLHGVIGASAGGGWSTASDLHRFLLAMREDRILSTRTREVLWSPKPKSPKYGYGFQIGKSWVGHSGGFPGIEAFVYYFPASGHSWIVMSNFFDSALPLVKKMRKRFEMLRPEHEEAAAG